MTVVDDRTGGALGSLEKLAARDVRGTQKHTGLSGVIDPALRVALDCFDKVDLSGIGVTLPSFSALDLLDTKATRVEDEAHEAPAEHRHGDSPHRKLLPTRGGPAVHWYGGGPVWEEPAALVSDHLSAFGWDVDEGPTVEPDTAALWPHDVDVTTGVSADVNAGSALRVARNAIVHGAVFELLTSSGVRGPISLALELVLPGSWTFGTPVRPGEGHEVDVAIGLPDDASFPGRVSDVHSRALREALENLYDVDPAERQELELPSDADVVTTVRALVEALGLPLRDVLKAAGIRRSSFHSWDKPGKPRPRTNSVGRLWALAQAVEDLTNTINVPLGRWLLAAPKRHRLLLDGSFDELVELAVNAVNPKELRPSPRPSTSAAVRPDDGAPLLTPRDRPRKGVASQVVTRQKRGTSS